MNEVRKPVYLWYKHERKCSALDHLRQTAAYWNLYPWFLSKFAVWKFAKTAFMEKAGFILVWVL